MSTEPRKPGVATAEELKAFVEAAGDKLLVVDVRNANDPYDEKSVEKTPVPSEGVRPHGINLIWDNNTESMPLPPPTTDLNTPIITHCGAGGRGQKAKEYLLAKGYTNVINGGGPKETDLWEIYGNK